MGTLKKLRIAYILNIILALLELISTLWMMSGIGGGVLSASKFAMFRYFTVDSNVLMGIIAVCAAVHLRKVLRGDRAAPSRAFYVWTLTGTVGVTLTLLVTVFFLEPTMAPEFGPFALFAGSNFFLHLVNPILAVVAFVGYEKTRSLPFGHTVTGIVPMLLYAVYYVAEAVRHSVAGVVSAGYDWYGFLVAGVKSAWIVLPVIILFTWLISVVLWRWNRRRAEETEA